MMITIEINGQKVFTQSDENLLTVLRRNSVRIPTLCHLEGLLPNGACRLCVVEIEGEPVLVPSCSCTVTDGMKIHTHSERVLKARRLILELLLAEHPAECYYCDRNGNCSLQSLAAELGIRGSRFSDPGLFQTRDGKKIEPSSSNAAPYFPNQTRPNPQVRSLSTEMMQSNAASRTIPRTIRPADRSDAAMIFDQDKCILCGRCVRICEEMQSVKVLNFCSSDPSIEVSPVLDLPSAESEPLKPLLWRESCCVHCGQCIPACPTGALSEQPHIDRVRRALQNPLSTVVFQLDPALCLAIGEEFSLPPDAPVEGLLTAALHKIRVERVYSTAIAADLMIMENSTQLLQRIREKSSIPIFSSFSPAWVSFVKKFFPEFQSNLAPCWDPQRILSILSQSYDAMRSRIRPENLFLTAATPCLAQKSELLRPEREELLRARSTVFPGVNAILSTRELVSLLRLYGINLTSMNPEPYDPPFSQYSTAGFLTAASGGESEAVARTLYYMLTGEELSSLKFEPFRGIDAVKEVYLEIDGEKIGFAVISGLDSARKFLNLMKSGEKKGIHFLEVSPCPGGCLGGSGQPFGTGLQQIEDRMKALYRRDEQDHLRTSHNNPDILRLYQEYLSQPGSDFVKQILYRN